MARSRTSPASTGLLGCGALLAAAALITLGSPSPAAAQQVKRIGATAHVPAPACPANTRQRPCEAVGSVTGFQAIGAGRRALMRAPEDGRLVAWAVRMSRPTSQQQRFFGNFYQHTRFGTRPTARIAVLRRTEGRRFRLIRHGPVADLTAGLGTRQIYTLTEPLRIRRGQILALTIPTWSPSFAVNLPARRNVWRASRRADRCTGTRNIRQSNPHQGPGNERVYGCIYRTARLLYWGFYVPD